jgi:alpha-amylase
MSARRFIIVSLSALSLRRSPLSLRWPRLGRGKGALRALHSLRPPVTDERFYFVMADRFENGNPGNDRGGLPDERLVSGFDPTHRGFYNGGDLPGLLRRIDYIRGLGPRSG